MGGVYHLEQAFSGCRFPCCTSSDLCSRHLSISQARAEQAIQIGLKTFLPLINTISDKTEIPFAAVPFPCPTGQRGDLSHAL